VSCGGCRRIRRVLGIQRPRNGDMFPDGLNIGQKLLHLSFVVFILASSLAMIMLSGMALAELAMWASQVIAGQSYD
jgi:hypothetical protein